MRRENKDVGNLTRLMTFVTYDMCLLYG